MREKLPDDGKEVEKYMVKMSGRLAEVELHELEPTDAELLLRTCSEVVRLWIKYVLKVNIDFFQILSD